MDQGICIRAGAVLPVLYTGEPTLALSTPPGALTAKHFRINNYCTLCKMPALAEYCLPLESTKYELFASRRPERARQKGRIPKISGLLFSISSALFASFFCIPKMATPLFSINCELFGQNHPGWGSERVGKISGQRSKGRS